MSFPIHPLDKALGDISSIRRQVARTTEFHGYGAATLAATGLFAVLAAVAQAFLLPDPVNHVGAYLRIWITTAILSAVLIGMQTLTRTRRIHSGMADEMILMAVEQFIPSVGAGALISIVLIRFVPGSVWMLPGLWQITFSLGVFASCRFLPKPMAAAGCWYLLTGLICIGLGDTRALTPWTMGIAYGIGQFIVAAVLLLGSKEERDEA
ncbi:hypothetical protein P8935_08970 [Telmatobacter sp. DSM 110680]|uniref:Uncharacterized protein n=1 Tax=Telmatobacter sp. DSM 110680 TaxID=3036704 RepID=A0AAU7DPU6_9BACT